jgi:hypothetical protein
MSLRRGGWDMGCHQYKSAGPVSGHEFTHAAIAAKQITNLCFCVNASTAPFLRKPLNPLRKFSHPTLPIISPSKRILVPSALNQDPSPKAQNRASVNASLRLRGRKPRRGKKLNAKFFWHSLGHVFSRKSFGIDWTCTIFGAKWQK